MRDMSKHVPDEWPEGFFEEVVGGWKGEPIERPEQAPLELRALRTAMTHSFPTADIDEMLAQIERGYTDELP